MTIGIYALVFKGTDSVYIGQSVNIEARYKAHLSAFKHSRLTHKLLNAFNTYRIPELLILEPCEILELDSLEEDYIREFNSVNSGFNVLESSTPIFRGVEHPNSLYSKDIVYKVLELLIVEPAILFKSIAEQLDVSIAFIENISSLKAHTWLKEEKPIEYSKLVDMKGKRTSNSRIRDDFPTIIDPLGVEHTVKNARAFSEKYCLNHSHLVGVLNSKRKSHLRWRLKGEQS
jgi:hypothetical protein